MEINITLVNASTVVKASSEGSRKQTIVVSENLSFHVGGNNVVAFPNNDILSGLGINLDNLDAATLTLLGSPVTVHALVENMATQKFFQNIL